MEIVGIGTEIVECVRIGRMIEEHGELFLTRVFTTEEIRWCQQRKERDGAFRQPMGRQGGDTEGDWDPVDEGVGLDRSGDSATGRGEAAGAFARGAQGLRPRTETWGTFW